MSGARRSGWRRLVGPTLAALPVFAILVGLGVWQLDRKAWKESLLAAIASRTTADPVPAPPEPAWPHWDPAADAFRRVRLDGTFLFDGEVPVHGLAEEQRGLAVQGYYLFTPLRRPDGSVVVVNRGFVPTEHRNAVTRPAGPVTVTGILREPETRGAFVPANDPSKNGWFVRNLADMTAARDLARVAPFYVDADAGPDPRGWPRGGQTQVNLPNNHLQYAVTWFGLAGTLVAVLAAFAAGRLRERSGDELQSEDADHDQADAGEPQSVRRVAE